MAMIVAIMIAAAVRFAASSDNLWLDEIWSWMIAAQLTSPLDIITWVAECCLAERSGDIFRPPGLLWLAP